MDLKATQEQIAKLVLEARSIFSANMSAEVEAKFDTIMAEADKLQAGVNRAKALETKEAELRTSERPAPMSVDEAAKAEVRKAHFMTYLKEKSHTEASREARMALSDTTGSAGGYLIPTGFSYKLDEATKWFGGMRQTASSFQTASGNPLYWPNNNDTSNAGELMNNMTTPGTVDPQDTSFGTVLFNAYTASSKYIAVPNELLQDSAFDLIKFLAERFQERLGRCENKYFTIGTGTNQPGGLITGANVGLQLTTGNTNTISYDNLVDLIHSVDPSYRAGAKLMFHDTTLQVIRKIVDNYGHPLWSPGLNGPVANTILGYEFQINQDFPTLAAAAKTIAFGQLGKYMIRDVEGVEVKRLDEIAAYQNQTVFLAFTRWDGHLLDAGTHPVQLLQQSAS